MDIQEIDDEPMVMMDVLESDLNESLKHRPSTSIYIPPESTDEWE